MAHIDVVLFGHCQRLHRHDKDYSDIEKDYSDSDKDYSDIDKDYSDIDKDYSVVDGKFWRPLTDFKLIN